MMFPIILKTEPKERLCNYLENHGIETRDMLPLITHSFYKEHTSVETTDHPVSLRIVERGFYIGCHPNITPAMLNHIIQVFRSYYQQEFS